MGFIGPMEIGLLAGIALLFAGPKQFPKLARSIGESVRELRSAGKEVQRELEFSDEEEAPR